MPTATDWITAGATVVLVAVTGYYAYLTKRLATSAENSAKDSKKAAEAARDAAAASRASVSVEFAVSPLYAVDADLPDSDATSLVGVVLTGAGDTVFVHGLVLATISWPTEPDVAIQHLSYAPCRAVGEVPIRLHRGETVEFMLASAAEREDSSGSTVSEVEVIVGYSLDGTSQPTQRHVTWRGEAGKDFTYS